MASLVAWLLWVLIILLISCLVFAALAIIGAVFIGIGKGIQDSIHGKVQVQDDTVQASVRRSGVSDQERDQGWGPPNGTPNGQD